MSLRSLSSPLFVLALAMALSLPTNAFQEPAPAPPAGGGGGGGGTAPSPGAGTRTPTPSPTPGQGQQQPTFPMPGQDRMPQMEMVRPIFLSGKVLTTEGTPPPDPATIEMICNGIPRPMAYTNSKGNWSFQLGGGNNMVMP
ncbi:MAG: hypothetical protein C0506_17265, partial [Anaerolinea sp.]|nr:hypothetical protein [Anaerolinea sp.]